MGFKPGRRAVATTADPLTDAGDRETPVHNLRGCALRAALARAREWSDAGYWASVYNQSSGECVVSHAPQGHQKDTIDE